MKATISSFGRNWPMLIDIDKEECKKLLRRFELQAYANVMTALRAQGDLNLERRKVLRDLADILSIPIERHKCEVRRVLNDEHLYTIAYNISGPSVFQEWTIEGKRLIPLISRIEPTTKFTALANKYSALEAQRNASLPPPCLTRSLKIKPTNIISKKTLHETPLKKTKFTDNDADNLHSLSSLTKITTITTTTTATTTTTTNQSNVNNNSLNTSTGNLAQKRSKSQDSKEKIQKQNTPLSQPLDKITPPTPLSLSTSISCFSQSQTPPNISHPIMPTTSTVIFTSDPIVTTAPAKKTSKIAASQKAGSSELLIKTHDIEAHPLSPFSVSSARRIIAVSPSISQGLKSTKTMNAQKNDSSYGHAHIANIGPSLSGTVNQKGPGITATFSGNSRSNSGSNIIINQSTLTPTIISGNIGSKDATKGNIVNIVPIGTVSQQRILHHSSAPGSTGQTLTGQVLPQQVFVIPAGSTMTDMKNVAKVSTFPVQSMTTSCLSTVSGDIHHVSQQHHILPQSKVPPTSGNLSQHYHPQQTSKIISIPLESTKPNFLSGKPKFTYGMKAMTSAKVQVPVQQILPESSIEKSSALQMPMTLVTATSTSLSTVPMNSIPVTITTLPVSVSTIPITVTTVPVASSIAPTSSVSSATIQATKAPHAVVSTLPLSPKVTTLSVTITSVPQTTSVTTLPVKASVTPLVTSDIDKSEPGSDVDIPAVGEEKS